MLQDFSTADSGKVADKNFDINNAVDGQPFLNICNAGNFVRFSAALRHESPEYRSLLRPYLDHIMIKLPGQSHNGGFNVCDDATKSKGRAGVCCDGLSMRRAARAC